MRFVCVTLVHALVEISQWEGAKSKVHPANGTKSVARHEKRCERGESKKLLEPTLVVSSPTFAFNFIGPIFGWRCPSACHHWLRGSWAEPTIGAYALAYLHHTAVMVSRKLASPTSSATRRPCIRRSICGVVR